MFRKNNSRQNNRNSTRKPNPTGQRESGGQPKNVSPNYRVDLMAHTFTQQTGGNTPGFGQRQGNPGFGNQPRPQQPHHQKPRGQQPRQPQHQRLRDQQHYPPRPQQHQSPHPGQNPAKKGYVNITVEMPDELSNSFKEKNAAEGKTGSDVIIQLISLYNAGKVTL